MNRSARIRLRITLMVLAASAICLGGSARGEKPAAADATATGWVSDEACGATHTKPGGSDCVRKCLTGGASVGHPEWKPQRMVFVADDGARIWVVENPDALKGHEGDHVRISGAFDEPGKAVRVRDISAVPEPAPSK